MKLFELKYFTQVDQPSPVMDYVRELVVQEELLSVKQSWENGYHLCIFGVLDEYRIKQIKEELEQIQKEYPAPEYDVEEFRGRYASVARLTNDVAGLGEIYQNDIHLVWPEGHYSFENQEQLSLYLSIHHVFDQQYAGRYFEENEILDIILHMYPFVCALPEKELNARSGLHSNGYTSHLSHYVGLLNSLKETDRERVRQRFDTRLQDDRIAFETKRGSYGNQILSNELMKIYQLVCSYVDKGVMNFFSPKSFEKDIKPYLHLYNERHASLFQNEEDREKVLTDYVSCTNKWILNVLYEKLVLLKIKPLDKFYMNYFYSRLKYDEAALEVR